ALPIFLGGKLTVIVELAGNADIDIVRLAPTPAGCQAACLPIAPGGFITQAGRHLLDTAQDPFPVYRRLAQRRAHAPLGVVVADARAVGILVPAVRHRVLSQGGQETEMRLDPCPVDSRQARRPDTPEILVAVQHVLASQP